MGRRRGRGGGEQRWSISSGIRLQDVCTFRVKVGIDLWFDWTSADV